MTGLLEVVLAAALVAVAVCVVAPARPGFALGAVVVAGAVAVIGTVYVRWAR